MAKLTHTRLRELIGYNSETGTLISLSCRGNIAAGDRIGTINTRGYRQACIDGRMYYEHRLVWLYVFGEWPADQIDHINGDRADNRVKNLREVSQAQNNANSVSRRNTDQLRGAYYIGEKQRWMAQIVSDSRTQYLGYYDTAEEAHEAYQTAANHIHGKYAYHNRPQSPELNLVVG